MQIEASNALTERILGAAYAVDTELGPGLLETAYQACLAKELTIRGMRVEVHVALPVIYKGEQMVDAGYRIDLLIEG